MKNIIVERLRIYYVNVDTSLFDNKEEKKGALFGFWEESVSVRCFVKIWLPLFICIRKCIAFLEDVMLF
jgi:hypothetical protein